MYCICTVYTYRSCQARDNIIMVKDCVKIELESSSAWLLCISVYMYTCTYYTQL